MSVLSHRFAWCLAGLAVLGCDPPVDVPPHYEAMFRTDRVAEWKLTVSRDNWLRLQIEPDRYVEADLEVDGRGYPRVGLRLMGNERRPKRSMRIRFNAFDPWLRFHGVKRVNLRANRGDPTLVRELLSLRLMRRCGVPAPRASVVLVRLNGAEGVYTLVEQVDRKFLADRFGENDGNLYKLERGGTLSYLGDSTQDYDPTVYELKTDDSGTIQEDLVELIRVLDRTPDGALRDALDRLLDLEATLLWLAVNSWLVNLDSYPGTGDNLYLYRDEAGRFHPIPWELNRSFGNYHGESCGLSTDELLVMDPRTPTCGGERPLVDRLFGESSLVRAHLERLAWLIDGPLDAERLREEVGGLREHVREAAERDALNEYSFELFLVAFDRDTPPGDNPVRVPGLVPFIEARDARCRQVLLER